MRCLHAVGLSLLLSARALQPAQPQPAADVESTTPQKWMLTFGDLATNAQMKSVCEQFGDSAKCDYTGHPSDGGVPVVVLTTTKRVLQSMVSLQAESVEADGATKLIAPVSREQMIGVHRKKEEHWGLDRINGRQGLDHNEDIESTGEGINIFSFDTGVQVDNPDFGGRAVPAVDFTLPDKEKSRDWTVCKPEAQTECAYDGHGHGTHTAGIAASLTYGVAKKATVHAVKVLADNGGGQWSWFVSGVDWVVRHMKKESMKQAVITASLGGTGPVKSVTRAIDSATAAGVSVVVAAGNEHSNACDYLPAQVTAAITVGSTDEFDQMSYFSNYGRCVDVFAPGSHVISLGTDEESVAMSGTSMAAPFVAGAVALAFGRDAAADSATVAQEIVDSASLDCLSDLPGKSPNKFLFVGPLSEAASTCSPDKGKGHVAAAASLAAPVAAPDAPAWPESDAWSTAQAEPAAQAWPAAQSQAAAQAWPAAQAQAAAQAWPAASTAQAYTAPAAQAWKWGGEELR